METSEGLGGPSEGPRPFLALWISVQRWNIGGQRALFVMLLIGFLFGVVTLSVILVIWHIILGT